MVGRIRSTGRNWNALSEGYRTRLERNGISRQDYERGVSVTAARGHAQTPERPQQAARDETRFSDYLSRRAAIADRVEAFKRERWGDSPNYNPERSRRAILNHGVGVQGEKITPRTMANLRAVADALDDYDDLEGEIPDDIADAFHYH